MKKRNAEKKNTTEVLGTSNSAIEKAIQIMKESYDQNVSLESICEELSISRNYFCYLFKKETGENVWTYLTRLRMEKAKELLRTTNLKSAEIGRMTGYQHPSYFSKVFKDMYGMTPNGYRAKKQG